MSINEALTDDRSPAEQLIDERLDALLDKDWDRYNKVGERLLSLVQERNKDVTIPRPEHY